MSTVIKVENISKQYRLGDVGTGSLAHDLNRTWHKIWGKEDPYLKIGEANDRTVKGSSDYVWALKDINFDVQQGEVIGIIGRNGAGKSTLLKILSRTTMPTTGNIKIKGRIASLLEVGTGFHPELSGRDNIFLNGAILGMTKREIKSKFDEIVDFAGVERYIDTPVKRYSSGMYVRLAFGVAAHLEPEILIVDEVLAVGDIEFQKKAIGKMRDVSEKGGRTVLFVSHNMEAIKSLTTKSILLGNGNIDKIGQTSEVLEHYNSSFEKSVGKDRTIIEMAMRGNKDLEIFDITVNGSSQAKITLANNDNELLIQLGGNVIAESLKFNLDVKFTDLEGRVLAFYSPGHIDGRLYDMKKGQFSIDEVIKLPSRLSKGAFMASINLSLPNKATFFELENAFCVFSEGLIAHNGRILTTEDIGWIIL